MSYLARRNGIYWFKADLSENLAGKSFAVTLPQSVQQLESPKSPGRFKTPVWKSLHTSTSGKPKRKCALQIAIHERCAAAAREVMRGLQPLAFAPEQTSHVVHD